MKYTTLTTSLIAASTVVFMGVQPAISASNVELEERISKLEMERGGGSDDSALGQISEWVTVSGAVEVEAGFVSYDQADTDESDISLATAELGVEAQPLDWTTGFMLLSWDDDAEELVIDEAHITLGATEEMPAYMTAGKLYVPFGAYESMMISGPITQDLGEIAANALQAGIDVNGFRAAGYIFNGGVDEADSDDTIESYGISLGYALETEQFSFDVGADWVNNILESGLLGDALDGVMLDEYVPGYALHTMLTVGPVCLIGEYVAMTDDAKEVGGEVAVYELSAYAVEAGITFDLAGLETTVALGYQASDTDNAAAYEDFPETVILGSVGVGITDNLSMALEYATVENYSGDKGGDCEEVDALTLQMAFEF
ncbi:MAG: hypothetical protein CSA33_04335 [Desulfobulbus propionicus]|nr:MAG: hypothetical protein CSA33_04335 [Desulfobulbus propionicus]